MKDWRPNWENRINYPNPESLTKEKIAWEFLRRNLDYQNEYQRIKELPNRQYFEKTNSKQKGFSKYGNYTPVPSENESYDEYVEKLHKKHIDKTEGSFTIESSYPDEEFCYRYGLEYCSIKDIDPSNNLPPKFITGQDIEIKHHHQIEIQYTPELNIKHHQEKKITYSHLNQNPSINFPDEIIVKLSAIHSIEEQINKVKTLLLELNKTLSLDNNKKDIGKLNDIKNRMYILWLRLLDAEFKNISVVDIADNIYGPDKDTATVKKNIIMAKHMCKEGYLKCLNILSQDVIET